MRDVTKNSNETTTNVVNFPDNKRVLDLSRPVPNVSRKSLGSIYGKDWFRYSGKFTNVVYPREVIEELLDNPKEHIEICTDVITSVVDGDQEHFVVVTNFNKELLKFPRLVELLWIDQIHKQSIHDIDDLVGISTMTYYSEIVGHLELLRSRGSGKYNYLDLQLLQEEIRFEIKKLVFLGILDHETFDIQPWTTFWEKEDLSKIPLIGSSFSLNPYVWKSYVKEFDSSKRENESFTKIYFRRDIDRKWSK